MPDSYYEQFPANMREQIKKQVRGNLANMNKDLAKFAGEKVKVHYYKGQGTDIDTARTDCQNKKGKFK